MKLHYHKYNLSGKIRIISGCWKGRKIPVLNYPDLRPTSNRMRETLFNWLSPFLPGSNCLDCFAGSGALGIEALSRGAASTIFIEKNYIISLQLTKFLKKLNSIKSLVITANCINWLIKYKKLFNIIFIDPPFRQIKTITTIVNILKKYQHIASKSLIYIETNQNLLPVVLPKDWYLYRLQQSNQVIGRLYLVT